MTFAIVPIHFCQKTPEVNFKNQQLTSCIAYTRAAEAQEVNVDNYESMDLKTG